MSVTVLVALALILVVALFAAQNSDPASVRLLRYTLETTVGLVIVASAAAGGLLVGLLGLVRQVRMGVRAWEHQNRLRRTESELEEARGRLAEQEQVSSRLRGELESAQRRLGETGSPASPAEDASPPD